MMIEPSVVAVAALVRGALRAGREKQPWLL